jgi:2-phospho-L-lactate/phosphoenolpyruvate guanylyltransferase
MQGILIPVKKLADAKQRLSPHYSASARRALADALWQDFFEVVAEVRRVDRVFVVSAEPEVLRQARHFGWEALAEERQVSESVSVDLASRRCSERGVASLLRLPVDLPLARVEDIESLFQHAQDSATAVIAPSRDGDGTNALLRKPPTLFPSRFGPGSFKKHLREARRARAIIYVLRNRRLEVDVDEFSDLEILGGQELRGTRTRTWLAQNFKHRTKTFTGF